MNTDRFTEKAREAIIVQPLALKLLQGAFHDGDHLVVEVENGHYAFKRKSSVPPAQAPADVTAES